MGEAEVLERLALEQLLRRLRNGRVNVRYWDGQRCTYGRTGPTVTVYIKSPRIVRRAVRNPTLAFGEGFMRGELEIDEAELDDLFWILTRNCDLFEPILPLYHLHGSSSPRRRSQRRHIGHHYDVGNDYYRLFLDSTLSYSCAYFENDEDSLEDAQRRKIHYLLRKLRLEPNHRILDIGSGWGYLAVSAARDYGALALGITLSEEQLVGAREMARREGVADTARFMLLNYQDLPGDPARYLHGHRDGRFDRVISVGMFEHVGRGQQHKYFRVLRELLAEGGVSVLHTITSRTSRRTDSWVDRYIFPGGHLPTVSEVERQLADHELWSIDRENLWRHYVRTLDCWRANHHANRNQITELMGAEFYRMRTLWLAGSQAGFGHGDLGLSQFVFTRGKPSAWPMTRRQLYQPPRDSIRQYQHTAIPKARGTPANRKWQP